MKKQFSDALIIGGLFGSWRVILFGIERIAPAFWPLRENFLGLVTPWANFDGVHYTSIAKDGYGVYQTAFFPLYPILTNTIVFFAILVYATTGFLRGYFIS